jgi:hypothetical protein
MMRTIALLLAAGALVAGAAAAPGAGAATPKPVKVTITVGKKGVPGGPRRMTIKRGSRVLIVVVAAKALHAEEMHLHGYDLERKPRPGKPTRLAFTAKLSGVFELELHLAGGQELQIGELTVR